MAEEKTTLAGLKAKAEELCKQYNGTENIGEAAKIAAQITETVNEYTGMVRKQAFDECLASPNPMIAAVSKLEFTTIGAKDVVEDGASVAVKQIVEKKRPIVLADLHKRAKGGIGADPNWIYMTEQLNKLLTARVATEITRKEDIEAVVKEIDDSFAMSEIAKSIKFTTGTKSDPNPVSNTNLLKTLQAIVTAMLGEGFKATSHDVAFLTWVYSKKGKSALHIACSNTRFLQQYIAEICHRILLEKAYAVDYRKASK